jgi:hypothetical protein
VTSSNHARKHQAIPPQPAHVERGRIPAALSLAAFVAFSAIYLYASIDGGGCWGAGLLLLASAALLCVPGAILLLVAICLRPSRIWKLGAALLCLILVTTLISGLFGTNATCTSA